MNKTKNYKRRFLETSTMLLAKTLLLIFIMSFDNLSFGQDTDGDGVLDSLDIDDDNDGIRDSKESPSCYYESEEYESGVRSNIVTTTTGISMISPYNNPEELIDSFNRGGVAGDIAVRFTNGVNVTGITIYQFDFNWPIELSNVYLGFYNASSHFNNATVKLQGSADGTSWTDLNTGVLYNTTNDNSSVLNIGTIRNEVFSVTQNSGKYKYYRLYGVSGTTTSGGYSNEVYFETKDFRSEDFPKSTCATDTDGDGIYNHLDLDSDDDGCSDAMEAGVSPTTNLSTSGSLTRAVFSPAIAVGINGLVDEVETSIDSDTINYGSTYNSYATTDFLNVCADTDGDGINDLVDIDDDNDGIKDSEESPLCYYVSDEYQTGDRSSQVIVTTSVVMHATYNNPEELVDGDNGTGVASYAVRFTNAVNVTNTTIFQFDFNWPIELSNIYLGFPNSSSHFNNATVKLQGSNDGSTWTDLNAGVLYNTTNDNSSVLNVGTIRNEVFVVSQNAGKYSHYRLFGVSGNTTSAGESTEVYFETKNFLPEDFPKSTCDSDTDSDGLINIVDIDTDNDGIPDNIEAQSTSNYIGPSGIGNGISDINVNGMDDVYESSQGGVDIFPVNSDFFALLSDLIPDFKDLDSDNDLIIDLLEAGYTVSTNSNDADNDGLLDHFDDVFGADVNDDINDPNPTILLDSDLDVSLDGTGAEPLKYDLDYRDNTTFEIMGNGIDDDGDGLVDCNDPDCAIYAECIGCELDGIGLNNNGDTTWHVITPEAGYNRAISYRYTGFDQAYLVPAGVSEIKVSLWGAGGGGGRSSTFTRSGAGGFTGGILNVGFGNPIILVVGESGRAASNIETYGGGGAGGTDNQIVPGPYHGGSGGGRSALRLFGTELATASGGGGSAGATAANLGTGFSTSHAGAGGGVTGENGSGLGPCMNSGYAGQGGNQTLGGNGGLHPNELNYPGVSGSDGSQFKGGKGGNSTFDASTGAGGGGGGGYYGGGGGKGQILRGACTVISSQEAAGGGGSGYSGGLTLATLIGGVANTPANTTNANYVNGIGSGVATNLLDGGPGLIVVQWYSPISDICSPLVPIVDFNTIFKDSTANGNVLTNDFGEDLRITEINGTTVGMSSTITTLQGGSLTIDSLGNYSYTPALGFVGIDSIVYTVCNNATSPICKEEYLIIEVLDVADPSNGDNSIIGNPDKIVSYGDTAGINLLSNDYDPEWDELDFKGVEDPNNPGNYISNGTLGTVPGVDSAGNMIADAGDLIINPDGSVEFVPAPGFVGNITLSYQVCDTVTPPACTDELIEIEVFDTVGSLASTQDAPPIANDDFAATDMNTPVNGNFFGNDYDPDKIDALTLNGTIINPSGLKMQIQSLSSSNGGTVEMFSDGTFTYTPPLNFSGTDMVEYEICDTSVDIECVNATIHLLVAPIVRDYQDLPTSTHGGVYARFKDGANNSVAGTKPIWLGAGISDENSANTSSDASTDYFDDGLIAPTTLDYGIHGSNQWHNAFQVIVNSSVPGIKVYFKLSVDWDDNGSFDSSVVSYGTTSSPDTVTVGLRVPSTFVGGNVNFRLVAQTDPARLDNSVLNGGEVEDYQVTFPVPLPVSLLAFKAKLINKDAFLNWSTSSELNNDKFEVLRSLEGDAGFVKIGEVKGAGTSNEINEYSYIDDLSKFSNGLVYYRLNQVDFNGNSALSKIRVLKLNNEEETQVVIYPNPATEELNIETKESSELMTYAIYNTLGQEIKSGQFSKSTTINVKSYSSGVYMIRISTQGELVKQLKLIIE